VGLNSTDGGKVWTCFTTGTGTPLASKYVPSNCRS
jgi:altronate dehydratase